MRLVFSPIGTRGDVQPVAALALEMQLRGHEVEVVGPNNYSDWMNSLGLRFRPCLPSFAEFIRPRELYSTLVQLGRHCPEIFEALFESCQGSDAIIGATLQMAGQSIAQKLDIPYFSAVYCPALLRSRAGLPVMSRPTWLPKPLGDLIWTTHFAMWNFAFRRGINKERDRLGLPPVADVQKYLFYSGHTLVACDPYTVIIPPSLGNPQTATGFWYLDDKTPLPGDISSFLANGTPPIYFGFGSMKSRDAARTTRKIVDAARQLGRRAVLLGGWAGLGKGELPPDCIVVKQIAHSSLLPLMSAIVHHGGAGTFAAAARAGVPQVIVPHFGDQYYWGGRAHSLGVAPPMILEQFLTRKNLVSALEAALFNPRLRIRAIEVGQLLAARSGIEEAADIIEATVADPQARRQATPRSVHRLPEWPDSMAN